MEEDDDNYEKKKTEQEEVWEELLNTQRPFNHISYTYIYISFTLFLFLS